MITPRGGANMEMGLVLLGLLLLQHPSVPAMRCPKNSIESR
jgi:hypothetical protein